MDFLSASMIFLGTFNFLLSSSVVLDQPGNFFAESEKCEENFVKVGCFRDNTRPLPKLLLNMRNAELYETWDDWEEFMERLVCRCAKKARKKAFTYFGLQFYGECWSGVRENVSYDNDGPSKGCVGKTLRQRCRHSDPLCVGKAKRNFIYKLVAPTSPPDCKDNNDVCEEYKEYCHYEHVRSNCRRLCKQC
ncbi:uncharacterized protein [Montipora capricornis]|uniref:uncharacterized protein n=1 Tax=Montipora capricornis TaxID=246305 RepID=UPI0035F1AF45